MTLPKPTPIAMEYGEAWLLEILALMRLPVGRLRRNEKAMREWLNRAVSSFLGMSKFVLGQPASAVMPMFS